MDNPFENLSKAQIKKLYVLLDVHIYKYNKDQEIIPTIKTSNIIGILLKGSAEIIQTEYNGNEIIVEELEENSVFGSNISNTSSENYEILAKEYTEVLVIDYNKLLNSRNLKYSYFNVFFQNLFNIINIKFKEKNDRIKVLEKKQIRNKLLEYFDIEYKKSHSKNIYLPFSLKELADYIAVNRSAMFREIKNLKDDRFIEIKNKRITLLYK